MSDLHVTWQCISFIPQTLNHELTLCVCAWEGGGFRVGGGWFWVKFNFLLSYIEWQWQITLLYSIQIHSSSFNKCVSANCILPIPSHDLQNYNLWATIRQITLQKWFQITNRNDFHAGLWVQWRREEKLCVICLSVSAVVESEAQ